MMIVLSLGWFCRGWILVCMVCHDKNGILNELNKNVKMKDGMNTALMNGECVRDCM